MAVCTQIPLDAITFVEKFALFFAICGRSELKGLSFFLIFFRLALLFLYLSLLIIIDFPFFLFISLYLALFTTHLL